MLRHLHRAHLSTRIIGITVVAAVLPLVAFTVVATIEDRHLREELRTSFENEARQQLRAVTHGVLGLVRAQHQTIQEDTRSAVDAISKIHEVIRRVHDISTSIAGAVEEQTATTNEISRNVQDAARGGREIAQAISTGASEGLGAAAELARMAAQLQSLTDRFRI